MELAEGSQIVGLGQSVLPLYVSQSMLKHLLVVVLLGHHVPADQVVEELVRVPLFPRVDLLVLPGSLPPDLGEVLVVFRGQFQPPLVAFLEGGVTQLLDSPFQAFFVEKEVSLEPLQIV